MGVGVVLGILQQMHLFFLFGFAKVLKNTDCTLRAAGLVGERSTDGEHDFFALETPVEDEVVRGC